MKGQRKKHKKASEIPFRSFCGEGGTLFWRFLFSNLFIIRYLKFQKIIFWAIFLTRF